MSVVLTYPINALTGSKRKAQGPAVMESDISLSPDDSGFNPLVHAYFKASLSGPDDVLQQGPAGMTVQEKESGQISYPPDKCLQDLWKNDRKEYERLKSEMFAHPKCKGMDFFTKGLYTNLKDNTTEFYEDESFVSFKASLDTPDAAKRSLELEQYGNTRFHVPKFTEETGAGRLNIGGYKNEAYSQMMLQNFGTMKLFDFLPTFFDSDEEAAVYFEYTIRQFLPKDAFADKVNTFCEAKQIRADVSAICFSGIGQWFMNAIQWTTINDSRVPSWPVLEAKASCLPRVPADAVVVVDVSMASAFPVRDEFERYGATAFFNEQRELVGVWIDHEEEMVLPPPAGTDPLDPAARDWEFAQWRFRVSCFFQGFAVGHLVTVHWGMSNSLLIGTRESLDPHHPLRELITPYIHKSISINKSAIVNLGSDRGAIVRIGALETGGPAEQLVESLADQFKYETFPEFLASKGQFPPGMLESLPMYEDGMKLWNVIETFVQTYVGLFYDQQDGGGGGRSVSQDPDVVAFWSKCKATSRGFCNLPELNFRNLVGYISTCIFYFTGVHELLGNVNFMTMMPRCLSGRIHKRDRFGDHPFQASIQDWYRIICVVTSTTLESMPMLIPQQFRSASYFFNRASRDAMGAMKQLSKMTVPERDDSNHARDYRLGLCYQTYADGLVELSKEIAAANETRELTFGAFNPKRLEISVSL